MGRGSRERSQLSQRGVDEALFGADKRSQTYQSLAKHFIYSPPFFCPIHKLEQLQPFTVLQKDLTKRHPFKKKKLPYGQKECKSLHTVKTTLLFKRKKKQPHQSAWMTCAFRWTVVKLGFLIRAHCLDSLESQSL